MIDREETKPGRHLPVMPAEVVAWLEPQPGQVIVDCTAGGGGHSQMLAKRGARVIAIDQDATMLVRVKDRLAGLPVTMFHASFDAIGEVLKELGLSAVDGVLADLGICSEQLDDANRGFSFTREGQLDMRLDATVGESAAELLRRLPERELADLIYQFGEERMSRRIARRIVEARAIEPIETTGQLADLVRRCVPKPKGRHSIDPATRTFQALRIAVNDELGALSRLLNRLPEVLKSGGRAVLISFHSLEDRLVKQAFRQSEFWDVLTKKVVLPGETEVNSNPRARSAKLRAAQRK